MSSKRRALCSLLTIGLAIGNGCNKPAHSRATHEVSTPAYRSDTGSRPQVVARAPGPAEPLRFVDAARLAGIHFEHNSGAFGQKYLPETMGSGVCFLDYDNDGWQDILFVNSIDWPGHASKKSPYPALYRNNHDGTFTDVAKAAGLGIKMYGMGCAVGDYDNDGLDDLYITGLGGNHLFHNLGNGRFADVTVKAGVADSGFATSAVWFDYDNDGRLDLFVSHYVTWSVETDQRCTMDGVHKSYCTPAGYQGQSSVLFHNDGHGRFTDVTRQAGLYDSKSKSLGIAVVDFDNDGWVDLFVANDTEPNKLYRNNHNGTFTDEAVLAGVAFSESGNARAGMGVDAADYDGSGRQSIVIGNFTNESMALYHNEGSGLFTDLATQSGIAGPSAKSLTFSALFFDYDLDGLPDIFALNGHVADDINVVQPTISYAERPLLFRNRGHGHFEDVTASSGDALLEPVVGRGAAYGDIDNSGRLDLALTANNGAARLLRNTGNGNDALRIKLVGTRSNRDGIGARVTVWNSSGIRVSETVKSGSSYLSQSELPLTFGLGKPKQGKTVNVDIRWPSGRKDVLTGLAPNEFFTLKEGNGIVSVTPLTAQTIKAD